MSDIAERLARAGVRVKPLVWRARKLKTGVTVQRAKTPFGYYVAGVDMMGQPYWFFGEGDDQYDCATLEAARAAAEAGHAARIMAALEAAPD